MHIIIQKKIIKNIQHIKIIISSIIINSLFIVICNVYI